MDISLILMLFLPKLGI